jgi:hypothetical protein
VTAPPHDQNRTGGRLDEAGSGVLSSAMGLAFFLGFLFVTTSVLLTLFRTSAVSAAATDAAHAAARASAPAIGSAGARGVGARACDAAATAAATDLAQRLLGTDVRVEASCVDGPAVSVTVEAPRPALGALLGRGPIRRTAEARFEARQVPA